MYIYELSVRHQSVAHYKPKNKKTMRKILFTTAIIGLLFTGCKKEDKPNEEPGWDTSLGRATFATDSIWAISGNGITQIWSDAVQTVNCSNKTSFNGGDFLTSNYNIDCRSNPNYKGDLFSWRAVSELKDELCPKDWRVPTLQDFIDLDIALGGTGSAGIDNSGQNNPILRDKYLNVWGGAYGGTAANGISSIQQQGLQACYWSQSDHIQGTGHNLRFNASGDVNPQNRANKAAGFTLRCVRNN
jgi:uncharacterized protein (TIGR02145 family)